MRMNLKRKIVLFILPIVVLSFALTIFIVSREAQKSLLKESYAGIKMIGDQAAANIHFKTAIALRDAVTLSKTPAVIAYFENISYDMKEEAEVARKEMEIYFSEFLDRAGIYSRLIYIDPQGKAVVDKGRVNGAEKEWTTLIQSAPQLKNGKPAMLPTSYQGKNYAVHFLVPARDKNNALIGYVLLDLDWNLVLADLQKIKIGKNGYILIADRKNGKVLCYTPDPNQIQSMDLRSVPFGDRILQAQSDQLDYTDADQKWLAYATAITDTDWVLAATIPWQEIVSAVSNLNRKIILAALFGTLLIFIFIWFFAQSIMSRLEKIIKATMIGADQTTSSSDQIASASQSLAEGTSEQAASIEEVSSSLEQLSSMTKNNADNASQGAVLIQETDQIIKKANDAMTQVTASMDDIFKAGEETAKIIKTIDEIAFQTNLLALNAAVEAARAGEAGSGFAIVADEVKNLAHRSAEAAKNTAELINAITTKVKSGVNLVGTTNATFVEASRSVTKMGNLVNEIAAASKEQAEGIQQINTNINQMDKVTQSNAANAEQTASASAEMRSLAANLGNMVEELEDIVGGAKQGETREETADVAVPDSF